MDEKTFLFLVDIAKVFKKHNMMIGGCGCCGSPWIEEMDKNDEGGLDLLIEQLDHNKSYDDKKVKNLRKQILSMV